MINFNNIHIDRLIIHTINQKLDGQEHATVTPSTSLLEIDERVLEILKIRLIDAAGKNSRSFELQLENTEDYSFYGISHDLETKDDPAFISATVSLAELLAESQKRKSIPGGYLIIVQAKELDTENSLIISVKAEPHEALQHKSINGQSQVQLLEKVFLSPSQKLYKIGILYEKDKNEATDLSRKYGCFLFDDQFRSESHPAEYFYKDFLGFSTSENAKIQTQRYYEQTSAFIKRNFVDVEDKLELLSALKVELKTSQSPIITPSNFAQQYISDMDIKDKYNSEIVDELPPSIQKDLTLISTKMSKRKINFPKNINVVGPDQSFDSRVNIVKDQQELDSLTTNSSYTIVKIEGKPYTNE